MNNLNRALRVMQPQIVSQEQYEEFISEQTLCWGDQEITEISNDLHSLSKKLNQLNSKVFQLDIDLIKTTGKEESEAYYTRSNFIVIPNGKISRRVLAHEIFHVFSRKFPELRDQMYGLINFYPENITLPTEVKEKEILNPDVDSIRHSIELNYEGQLINATPIILSAVDITQINNLDKTFFKYVNLFMINVRTGELIKPKQTDILARTGGNTRYIFHPEEIFADNFSFMLADEQVANNDLIEKIKSFFENL
jgi:hypothetical protein